MKANKCARTATPKPNRKLALHLADLRARAADEIERLIAFLDASDPYVMTELEDEHDGCEPDVDAEADTADEEPSLGWSVDGGTKDMSCRSVRYCDLEAGIGAREPQARSSIPGADEVRVERSYRNFLRGLPAEQEKAIKNHPWQARHYRGIRHRKRSA